MRARPSIENFRIGIATAARRISPTRFRLFLIVVLGLAYLVMLTQPTTRPEGLSVSDDRLHVFFSPQCPHCHDALSFLQKHHEIAVVRHDVSEQAELALLLQVARSFGLAEADIGVPFFSRGGGYLVGFDTPEISGPVLLAFATDPQLAGTTRPTLPGRVRLPLLGEIDPTSYQLPVLTIVMALADGFNPCAMWVLVYLISIIAGLSDPAKIRWLIGSFVLASGVLYFLFMTVWLNAFLIVGYVWPLTLLTAMVAIGLGADQLFRLASSGGIVACELSGEGRRRAILGRARAIAAAPLGLASLALVIVLAFTVNAIEFACSAALPAVYTHTLALLDLPSATYYLYILLYVVIFMLDDLIIFGMAVFAVEKVLDTQYAALSQAAGGLLLVWLGASLVIG